MTDSNIQPPDPSTLNEIPGTDVTFTTPAGLYPEDTTAATNINIDTTAAEGTFTVPPDNHDYAANVDFHVDNMPHAHAPDARLDHVLEHLHNLEAKLDQLICDCNHHKEPPVYQGHVVLHANEPTV